MTKLVTRLRRRLRSERGVAIPSALMLIIVGLGLSGAAISATVSTQRGSVRDQDRKEAIAVADAGVSQALFRENKISTTLEGRCVVLGTGGTLVAGPELADGWCAEQTGTVGGDPYAYRVMPWTEVQVNGQWRREMRVVSVGESDGVARRVAVLARAPTGRSIFGASRAIGVDGVTISGTSLVNVSTGSNASVTLENNGTLCGNATYGPGGDLVLNNNGTQCPGYGANEGTVELPPPDLNAVTQDGTWKFFSVNQKSGNATWDSTTRTLNLQGGSQVSVTGGDYLLCRLDMSGGSTLIMEAGALVRIFFDKPENCGWSPGDTAEQIKVTGSSKILSSGYNPQGGSFELPGFYMAGSDIGIKSEANFSGTPGALYQLVLYAPRTDVTITGTADYEGAVAGQTLELGGNATLSADQDMPSPDVQTVLIYRPGHYVECTGPTGSPPDANC
jgi:hypothetical protein